MTEISNLPAVTIPFSGTELFPVTQNQVTKKALLVDLTGYFSTPGILPFLRLDGGTMIGSLILAHDPVLPLEAATKQYVDRFLPLAGGTMTGPLFLARDPIGVTEAVTKSYVDAHLFPEAPNNLYTYGRVGTPSNYWNPVLALTGGTLSGGLSVPDLGVTNNVNVGGSVSVGGSIGVNGGLTVLGSASVGQNFGVGGNETIGGTLGVTGRIDSASVFTGSLFTGAITDSGDLIVSGNTYISGALSVGNGITTNNIHATNNITADGSISTVALFTTNLTAGGTVSAGTLSSTNLSATNLSVTGGITAGGQIFGNTVVGNAVTSFGDMLAYGNISANGGVYTNYIHSNGSIDAAGQLNGASLAISGIGTFGNYITCKAVFAAETLNSAGNVNTITYQLQGTPFAWSGANGAGAFTTVADSTGFPAIDMYGSNGTYYRTDNAHFFTNRAATFNICRFQASDGNCINGSGLWNSVSDSSTKENVVPYTKGLAELLQMDPVSFTYIPGTTRYAIPGQTYYGLIAQDVDPIVPEMVSSTTENDTTVATVASGHLVFLLLNAVKELAERLTALEPAAA